MLTELRKVIPSFLKRVDLPDRGGAWSAYLETNRKAMEGVAAELLGEVTSPPVTQTNVTQTNVKLLDWDPEGENKVIAAMLFAYSDLSEATLLTRVQAMSSDEKIAVVRAYCGERGNRRHRPGRALERVDYRFEVVSDYGAFRDLQRHRMLTIEWQALTPAHGYVLPESVVEAGVAPAFHEAMDRSATLYGALEEAVGPLQASYAVSLAYRVRYVMQMNARAAMHLIELRSGPQGHPEYRRVAQDMHTLIAREAGHTAIAELMSYADHASYGLERLDSERRAEERRATR
jgi:hypothetical protein